MASIHPKNKSGMMYDVNQVYMWESTNALKRPDDAIINS